MTKRTFEQDWSIMAGQGYQYGEDALEQVRMGWELRANAISLNERIRQVYIEFCELSNPVREDCPYPVDSFISHIAKLLNVELVGVIADDRQFDELEALDADASKRWPKPKQEGCVMKAGIIELDPQMAELVDLALWRSATGQHLETIVVPRDLLLRLYATWALARLRELAPPQSQG